MWVTHVMARLEIDIGLFEGSLRVGKRIALCLVDRPEVETGQLELSATRLDILNIENQLDQGLAFLLARRCRMKKDGQAAVMRPELYDAIFVSLVSGEAEEARIECNHLRKLLRIDNDPIDRKGHACLVLVVSSRRSATVSPDKVARLPICRQDLLTKHFGRRFEAQAFTRRRVEMGAHLVKVVVVNRQRIGVSR